MPPKPKKSDEDLAQQEVLQAMVLADSFASNFRPVTFTQPKVLMPLADVPMIEYARLSSLLLAACRRFSSSAARTRTRSSGT